MLKRFLIRVVLMMVVGIGAVIYTLGARAQDGSSGFSLEAVVGAFTQTREPEPEVDLRAFLPPARPGWERFEWNDLAEEHLMNTRGSDDIVAQFPDLKKYVDLDQAFGRARKKRGTWVYAGFDKLLSIRVVQSNRDGKGGGRHAQEELTNTLSNQNPRYALIRGVRYFEVPKSNWNGPPPKYRLIKGRLGRGITIYVRALADDPAIKSYLREIDYDGLLAAAPEAPKRPDASPWIFDLMGGGAKEEPEQTDKPRVKINRGLRVDCQSIGNPQHCRPMAVERAH